MKTYQLLAGATLLLLAAFSTSPMVRAQGDSGELWVTSQGTDRLFIVHGQGSSIETVPVPGIGPHITTFSPLGDYAYVSGMRNGDLSILRLTTDRLCRAPGSHADSPGQAIAGWIGAPRRPDSVDESDQGRR
jgi:DNA-binding beta-propeller fold protein YncE